MPDIAHVVGVSESPDVSIIFNGEVMKRPLDQFIVDIINQISFLSRQSAQQAEEIGQLREQLVNHNHYSQAGSMGQL